MTINGINDVKVRKPIGAFRGGITGFLLGFGSAGILCYVALSREFDRSAQLLFADIEALNKSVRRLEEKVASNP